MAFSKWTNKYVGLADTLPELLISWDGRTPTAEETAHISERCRVTQPIYVELGSGSGGHLITRAAQDPASLYVGFELRYKRAFRTAEKASEKGLKNLLVVRGDVSYLEQFFEQESLSGLYMNFPDPWERKKWRKHRMISEESLRLFHALLKPGASFRYKTDHQGYFDDTLKLIEEYPGFKIERMTRDLHKSEHTPDNVLTEFEQLFISKGLPTYFVELVKVP